MFLRIKRILMAEADAGGASGNGATAPVAPPAEANVTQAQGAPVISKEVTDYIQSEIAKGVKAERDSIFAEARRTFTEKRNKPKDDAPAQAAPQPLDAHEERRVLRDFDRSLSKLGLTDKVSSSQWSRAEKALLAERPDDVSSWVEDYFKGFGASPVAAPVAQSATIQMAPRPDPIAPHPVSNRGAPQAAQTPVEELDLVTASQADRDAFIKQKGNREYIKTLQKQLKGRPVAIGRR